MTGWFRYLVVWGLILLAGGCAGLSRRVSRQVRDDEGRRKKSEDIVIEEPARRLPEYEELTYRVKWLGIPAGTITLSVKGIEKIRGRDAYVLEALAKTNNLLSKIYKVNDRFVSYMDAEKLYTLRHEVHRREGRYKKDAITDFDQINHKAYFKNYLDKSERILDIPEGIQDTLSASYYFRLLPIKVGDKIGYTVYNNEKNYQLFAVVEAKSFVTIPQLGEKEAFLIQPYATLKGKRLRKGKARGYYSGDRKRLPVLIVIKAPIFTKVTVSLYGIE